MTQCCCLTKEYIHTYETFNSIFIHIGYNKNGAYKNVWEKFGWELFIWKRHILQAFQANSLKCIQRICFLAVIYQNTPLLGNTCTLLLSNTFSRNNLLKNLCLWEIIRQYFLGAKHMQLEKQWAQNRCPLSSPD